MFQEAIESQFGSHSSSLNEDLAADYHREVLSSYRLIFGQDSSSVSLFLSSCQKNPLPVEHPDALLPILCGKYWENCEEANQISKILEFEEPSPQYSASSHFPFLGSRLLDVQKHIKVQKLGSLKGFWIDRRNPSTWWNFWPALIFGVVGLGLVLLFGAVQTILAGVQVYYGRLQFVQQQNQLQT